MSTTEHVYGSAIPEISDKRLAKLAKTIRPVKKLGRKVRFFTKCDPRYDAFSWDSPGGKEATVVRLVGEPVSTLHTFNAPSFFKPTLAQVFAQMPDGIEDQANAFTIRYEDGEMIRPEGGGIGSGHTYHRATVQFMMVRQI